MSYAIVANGSVKRPGGAFYRRELRRAGQAAFGRAVLLGAALLAITQAATAAPLPRPSAADGNRPGSLDERFDPTARGHSLGLTGGTPIASCVLEQPDGKVLVGGWFNGVNDRLRNNVTRLNADGTLDPDFKTGYGPDGAVNRMALQPDGKVILIGGFRAVNGRIQPMIARLNRNGKLDQSFQCQVAGDANLRISAVAVQQSGKIWIAGQFTEVNGTPRHNLARLNSNGSLDTAFDPETVIAGTNYYMTALHVQADDKVLVGGAWSEPSRSVARLNADGSLDAGFATVATMEFFGLGQIRDISCNSNGTIAIVGNFASVNGQARRHVARLDSSGVLDAGFNPTPGPDYNFLWAVAVQPDGKVVVGGNFKQFNGVDRMGIARLNDNGTTDSTFDSGNAAAVPEGYYPHIEALTLQTDGRVLVAGTAWWGAGNRDSVFRLETTGQRDAAFSPLLHAPIGGVSTMVLQPDGKPIIGIYDGGNGNLLRLKSNGVPDGSFVPGTNVPVVHALALQPNGQLLVGTTEPMGAQTGVLLRLQPNGAVDTNFHAPLFVAGEMPIESLAVQPDGRILVGGLIWGVDGHPHQGIVRLHSDGQFDDSFQPVPVWVTDDPGYGIEYIFVLPGGDILIAGGFRWENGEGAGIALLSSNGVVNQTFSNNVERVLYVSAAAMQPDGKFVFSVVSGEPANVLIRINSDGTTDEGFAPEFTGDSPAITVQADGRILLAGGSSQGGVVRLEPDGSLDQIFQSDLPGWSVRTMELTRNGRILIAGGFHSISGIPIHGIARLNNHVRPRPGPR